MYRTIVVLIAVSLFATVALAAEPVKKLKIKPQGAEKALVVKLEPAFDKTKIKQATEFTKVGTVTLPERGEIDVLCRGKEGGKGFECQGKMPAGTVLHMESEFTDE